MLEEKKTGSLALVPLTEVFLESGILKASPELRTLTPFLRDYEEISFRILGRFEIQGSWRREGGYFLSFELMEFCRRLGLKTGDTLRMRRSEETLRVLEVDFPGSRDALIALARAAELAREIPRVELELEELTDSEICTELGKALGETEQSRISSETAHHALLDHLILKSLGRTRLLGLKELDRIQLYPHQIQAAEKALFECGGRALLADEVGMGKTIEAGIIMHELMKREEAERILVVAPASLTLQWKAELQEKFGLDFVLASEISDREEIPGRIIVSLDTAKSRRHRQDYIHEVWDMVIVDEAHKLKNRKTLNFQFVRRLSSRYLFLLTATPIQNDLMELYNLLHLLSPGSLGSLQNFRKKHVHPVNRRLALDPDGLRSALAPHMIRSSRGSTGLKLPPRRVLLHELEFSEAERRVYERLSDFIHEYWFLAATDKEGLNQLTLMLFQKLMSSSPKALQESVEGILARQTLSREVRKSLEEILEDLRKVPSSVKLEAVLELLQNELSDQKVLIFTQFRRTQEVILEALKGAAIPTAKFCGEMSLNQKQASLKEFQGDARVLVSTDAGSEGQNLQFARCLINFDLPWNPMKVEQRIGRIHRLGQKDEVFILNLCVKKTIEEHIVTLLGRKIRLFERIVGELEMILGYLGSQLRDLEALDHRIMEVVARFRSFEEQRQEVERMGQKFSRAAKSYEEAIRSQSLVLGEEP